MRYILAFIVVFSLSSFAQAQTNFPEPDLPDLEDPEPFDTVESEDDPENDPLVVYLDSLPIVTWIYQLREVQESLSLAPDYQRPVFIQYFGSGFGFLFWVNNNREALLGAFSPLFYNVLIFIGWALGAALIYVAVTVAAAIRRIVQDFINASIRLVSLIGEFIPF